MDDNHMLDAFAVEVSEMLLIKGQEIGRFRMDGCLKDRPVFFMEVYIGGNGFDRVGMAQDHHLVHKVVKPGAPIRAIEIPSRLLNGIVRRNQFDSRQSPQTSQPCAFAVGSRKKDIGVQEQTVLLVTKVSDALNDKQKKNFISNLL
jgi:hypothetical protein